MHYNTWPPIAQDPDAFAEAAGKKGHRVQALRPGDTVVVTRIDRLARSTFDLFAIVRQIVDAGARSASTIGTVIE